MKEKNYVYFALTDEERDAISERIKVLHPSVEVSDRSFNDRAPCWVHCWTGGSYGNKLYMYTLGAGRGQHLHEEVRSHRDLFDAVPEVPEEEVIEIEGRKWKVSELKKALAKAGELPGRGRA